MARVTRSVAQVVTERGTGTAFLVGNPAFWWVTAAHVVRDLETVTLLTTAGQVEAQVIAYDTTVDIAYLDPTSAIRERGLEWVDDATLYAGGEVAVVGFPTGVTGSPSVTTGRLSRIAAYPGDITFLQTDSAANPGNSGGPLITPCGDVAGVVISKLVGLQIEGIAYAVASSTAQENLRLFRGDRVAVEQVHDFWQPARTRCMSNEEDLWLRRVSNQLNRLHALSRDFAALLNIAVDEDWALVENDPTWKQAAIIAAFRFRDPSEKILDMLPGPGALSSGSQDLETLSGLLVRVARDLPHAIQTNDGQARDAALEKFRERREPWERWIITIQNHCQV